MTDTTGRDRFPRLRILIPARGGSTRIPHKNLQELTPGKTLLAWTLELFSALLPGVPITIATEDHETNKIALEHGCELHGRTLDDIQDNRDCYGIFRDVMDCYPDAEVLLTGCTSPFLYRSELELALANPLPYVYSAYTGALHTAATGDQKSQDIAPSTILTGNFFLARQPWLRRHQPAIWSHPAFASPVSWESATDINTPADLDSARRLARGLTLDVLLNN